MEGVEGGRSGGAYSGVRNKSAPENRIAGRAWSLAQVGRGAPGKTE